jgi:Caudovirus prohead serine protease
MPQKISKDQMIEKRSSAMRGASLIKAFRSPPSWSAEGRSATFVMTTDQVDRYGDIVVQDGLDTKNFIQNPTLLLFHNSRSWPAGTWSNVKRGMDGSINQTLGTANFLPEGTDEDADKAARLVELGVIKTCSIGFSPDWDEASAVLDDDDEWTGGIKFEKSELIECSIVPVPANPGAMVKSAAELGEMSLCRDFISEILDTWHKNDAGLIVPRAEIERAHKDANGNKSSIVLKIDTAEVQKIIEDAKDEVRKEEKSFFAKLKSFLISEKQIEEPKAPKIIEGSAVKAAATFAQIKAARARRTA